MFLVEVKKECNLESDIMWVVIRDEQSQGGGRVAVDTMMSTSAGLSPRGEG